MKRLYRLLILLPLTFIIIAMASCGSGDDVYDLVNGYEDIFVSDNISAGTKTVTVNIADNKKLRIKNGESNLIIDLKVVAKYGNKSRTIYDSSKHNYYIASNSKIDTGYILRKNKDFKISFIVGNRLKLDKQDEGIFKISNSEKKVILGYNTFIYFRGYEHDFLVDENTRLIYSSKYHIESESDSSNDLIEYSVDREHFKGYRLIDMMLKEVKTKELDIRSDEWNVGEVAPGEILHFELSTDTGYISWRSKGEIEPVITNDSGLRWYNYIPTKKGKEENFTIEIINATTLTKKYEFIVSKDIQPICEQGDLVCSNDVNLKFTPEKSGYYCSINPEHILGDKGFEYLEAGKTYVLRLNSNSNSKELFNVGIVEVSQASYVKSMLVTKDMICKVTSSSGLKFAEIYRDGAKIAVQKYVRLQAGDLFVYYAGTLYDRNVDVSIEEVNDYIFIEEDGVYECDASACIIKSNGTIFYYGGCWKLSIGDVIITDNEVKKLDKSFIFEDDCIVHIYSENRVFIFHEGHLCVFYDSPDMYLKLEKGYEIYGGEDLVVSIQDLYYELYIDDKYIPFYGTYKNETGILDSEKVILKVFNKGEFMYEYTPEVNKFATSSGYYIHLDTLDYEFDVRAIS